MIFFLVFCVYACARAVCQLAGHACMHGVLPAIAVFPSFTCGLTYPRVMMPAMVSPGGFRCGRTVDQGASIEALAPARRACGWTVGAFRGPEVGSDRICSDDSTCLALAWAMRRCGDAAGPAVAVAEGVSDADWMPDPTTWRRSHSIDPRRPADSRIPHRSHYMHRTRDWGPDRPDARP